jgi:hypothetical protein
MTAKMSFCVQAATSLQPYDLDAITTDIEIMAKAGLDMRDAERLAVESALAKAKQDRAETADAVREQHADLYVPKKAKAPSTSNAASQFFTMPDDYIEPPRQARRIVRGQPSINDPILPETDEFVGNMTGDLAVMPAVGSIKSKPIRLPVGAAYGPHKGFGIEHLRDNADRYRRTPPNVTPDAAENFARHALSLIRSGLEIYQDANGDVVLRDGRLKQAVVLEDRGSHYSVKTIRPAEQSTTWGQMIARKRTSPPVGELLSPGKVESYKFDMGGEDVRIAPIVPNPKVVTKPRRQFEMPVRQARAVSAAKKAGYTVPVLHGAKRDITEFDPTKAREMAAWGQAVYVGESKEAERVSEYADGDGGVIYPLLLKPGRVLDLTNGFKPKDLAAVEAEVKKLNPGAKFTVGGYLKSGYFPENAVAAALGSMSDKSRVAEAITASGFDTVKYPLDRDGGGVSYAVFDPARLKSSISATTFDPASRDIRQSRRAPDTPEFKAWFGDSKVTENGRAGGAPLLMHHGGGAGFVAFRTPAYFVNDEMEAAEYGDNVQDVYLSIKNPHRGMDVWDSRSDALTPRKIAALKKQGFDGIEARDSNTGIIHYIAFRPEQIKSAIGNSGAFSSLSPDIRQSRIYSEDQERQLQWLGERASQLGFGNVDELVDKDFDQFMSLAEQWREENPFNPKARAVEPAPMYASYPVENGEDIVAWAEEQGIRDIIPPEKMHVTVAYSRAPVDTRDLPSAPAASIEDEGRSVQMLGGDIVLMVQSPDLTARWAAIKEAGASWDFEDEAPAYKPHVTIAYGAEGADISDVEPYDGPIQLGDEEIEDLKSGWGAALKQSRPAAGYSLPGFGNGSLFVEKIQDRYNRWRQVIGAVRGQGGIVNEANDFYKAEERYWGKVGSKIEDFDAEVSSLLDGLVKDKVDTRSMQLYAYARHAKERNARLRTMREANPNTGFDSWSGMTDELADQILADAHQSGMAPLFEKHHKTLMAWTQETRDIMLRDGLITQDQYDNLQNSYDFYVPLKGKPGDNGATRPGTGSGFNVRGKETERAKGRYSEANDIIENIIADRVKALTRAGKNEVMRTFLKFVIDNPDPAQWQINATAVKPVMKIDDQGNQYIEEERQILKGEDTVGIKDGGREVFVRIKDPKLVEQMRNMNHQDVGWFVGHLLLGNRMLSRLYTSLSPVFTVLNFARDITAGTIGMVGETGFSGAARMLSYFPKALYQSAMAETGRPGSDYQLFRATGGKTGFMDFKTIEDLAKDLSNRVRDAERSKLDPRKFGPKALELIESVNGAIENSTRLAAFMAARDSGKTVAEAASLAKNITVNFNRKGTLTNNLAAWFLFFNPAVQGTTRVMQALKSPKVLATLGAGMSGLALLAMQNALVGDDDDGVAWWDKIPEEVKDRNIVIVLPPGSKQGEAVPGSKVGRYVKIPMPYGYNFFATVARLAVDRYRNGLDPARGATIAAATKRAVSSFLGAYMPASELSRSLETSKSAVLAAVPDVLNAPAQALLNINAFGKPMYPERGQQDENIADSSKYFAGQAGTIFQRAAGQLNQATGGNEFKGGLLDFTPATLENLARSYGGGPVSFALDLSNMVYARQSIERPDIDVRRSPFIKQLYGEIDAETDRQAGFQRLDKIHEVLDPIAAAKSAKQPELAAQMREEAGPIGDLGGVLKVINKQLTTLRKQELRIISSDASDSQKYAELMELSQRKREVFHRLNRAYDDAIRQPMPKPELTTQP